jgi:hypothetical protein
MQLHLFTLLLILSSCCMTRAGNKPEVVPQDVTHCQLAKDRPHFQESEYGFVPFIRTCSKSRALNRRRAAQIMTRRYG